MSVKARSVLIAISCFAVFGVVGLLFLLSLTIFGPARVVRFRKAFGRILIKTAGCRLEILGCVPSPSEACIYVGNHQSIFDSLVIAVAIPGNFSVVVKRELLKFPIGGRIITRMGFIFIDRSSRQEAIVSVKMAIEKIIAGISVVIFPEGTRSKTGAINQFKRGAFVVAQATEAPIVPFRIRGAFEANPKGWQFFPGSLTITFGEPIARDQYVGKLSATQLAEFCRERVLGL